MRKVLTIAVLAVLLACSISAVAWAQDEKDPEPKGVTAPDLPYLDQPVPDEAKQENEDAPFKEGELIVQYKTVDDLKKAKDKKRTRSRRS